ncbi:hypothetical protein J5N97_009813 [Dioscorea zingiberensis]|uniref:Uncharacterized protein n=1 Tax=Dioscorea zingiberensis TaxID=325984 RepID=A0A9D5HM77_9LILI|nr:hypothetical protein J5N97_009813 [Dioscorea zingiberensis]
MVGHPHGVPLEVVSTVLEMADMAWTALEHRRERKLEAAEDQELAQLRAENLRLRGILEENLGLLRGLSQTPSISQDCPPDLYSRLVAVADSPDFLMKLESLHEDSLNAKDGSFPFREATGSDLKAMDVLISVEHDEPSWWVWVTKEMVPSNFEEVSGIDNENYVIVSEDSVVDGIANFMARCIISNPRSQKLTPEELQRTMTRALSGVNDHSLWRRVWEAATVIYSLSTWGIALYGLYRHRAVLKAAAKGVAASGKFVMKGL